MSIALRRLRLLLRIHPSPISSMSTSSTKPAPSQSPTLSSFLQRSKAHLAAAVSPVSGQSSSTSKPNSPLTIVIGNQSADLDSFTSSTLYAFFRSHSSALTTSKPQLSPLYCPVLNIPAVDVSIRLEFLALLRHAHVDPSALSTLDDFQDLKSLTQRLPPDNVNLVLTDHNVPEGPLAPLYGSRVRGVIDHHEDERAELAAATGQEPSGASEPRIVQVCGSATTLVVREIAPIWDALLTASSSNTSSSPSLDQAESARLARFALGSVLIDTRNLTSQDKTTTLDTEIADYLRRKISGSSSSSSSSSSPPSTEVSAALFTELKAAKNDVSSLSTLAVLRKDYKAWTEESLVLGTSSAVKRLHQLTKKAGKERTRDGSKASSAERADAWTSTTRDFMAAKGCDLWLVLTSFNDDAGVHRRELALHWRSSVGEHGEHGKGGKGPDGARDLAWVCDEFERVCGQDMGLQRAEIEGMPAGRVVTASGEWETGCQTWLQMNGAMSRKQVAPALRKVVREGMMRRKDLHRR